MSAITYALAIILCSILPLKGDAGIVSFPHFLLGERFLKKNAAKGGLVIFPYLRGEGGLPGKKGG